MVLTADRGNGNCTVKMLTPIGVPFILLLIARHYKGQKRKISDKKGPNEVNSLKTYNYT